MGLHCSAFKSCVLLLCFGWGGGEIKMVLIREWFYLLVRRGNVYGNCALLGDELKLRGPQSN